MNNGTNTLPQSGRRERRKNAAALRCVTLLSCLLLMAACTKEPAAEPSGETVPLNLSAFITAEARVQSRAIVPGDKFPSDNKIYPIGMWVCSHEDPPTAFTPAMPGYGNLLASLGVEAISENEWRDIWRYTIDGTTYDILSVLRNKAVDIYAYYPHTASASDPTAVPFTTGETDWMWARPVALTSGNLSGSSVEVPLQFEHVMTALRVRIKCKYNGNVQLTSMTLTDTESRLYKAGSMNIVENKLNLSDADRIGELKLNSYADKTVTSSFKNFYILMPPVGNYADGQFELSFVFNNIAAQTTFKIPNTITKKDPNDPDAPGETVTITAFEAGKRYTYNLTLDNTMTFEPIGIDDEWVTVDDIEMEL